MFGRIVIVIAALLVGAGLAWALWPRPIEVETALITRGSFDVTVEEEGQSRIREVFTVSAPVTGRLQRLSLHAGDTVLAGQTTVAIIRPAGPGLLDERSRRVAEATAETAQAAVEMARTQLAQSQKQLDFAERTLERTISLSQRDLVSAQALEQAKYEVDVATSAVQSSKASLGARESELERARAALIEGADDAGSAAACCVELRAPVSGRILQVLSESEQVVQAGTPLLSIGDPADVEIAVELPSRDAVQLQPGAQATIDGWGGPPLAAELVRIEPMAVTRVSALGIEEQRTTATLKLLAPASQWERLGHGFRVVAHIVRWRGENVLMIPIGALFRLGGDWTTFVVEGGKAVARPIELGERNAEFAEVLAGVQAGDEVILHPADTIVDGTTVVVSASALKRL